MTARPRRGFSLSGVTRHARVEVDLDAIAHNVSTLAALAPESRFCAVVKADAYGHGALRVAPVALAAGADLLGVALVQEGAALRDAGIDAPILLLSEPPADELAEAWNLGLTPTLYHRESIAAAQEAVSDHGRWGVHLKVDTGMHRAGVSPSEAVDLAARAMASSRLVLEGVFTHMAVADDPGRSETAQQLAAFLAVVDELRARGIDTGMLHASNSAGLITHPATRLDIVRCGIAIYGVLPAPGIGEDLELRPAMTVSSEVSRIGIVRAGESLSYGLRHSFEEDTLVATVPVGYADGMTRRLWTRGGEVLIRGQRRPIRGVITMDQFMVELGAADSSEARSIERGEEVVMLGSQAASAGDPDEVFPERWEGVLAVECEQIDAWEWAERVQTIAYEVICGFSPRLRRVYHGG